MFQPFLWPKILIDLKNYKWYTFSLLVYIKDTFLFLTERAEEIFNIAPITDCNLQLRNYDLI